MRNAEDLPETGSQQRPLAEKEPGTLLSFEFEFDGGGECFGRGEGGGGGAGGG